MAILLVLMHHFGLFEPGWAGVDVFFVISGFLITGILLRTKNSKFYFRNFYARRALRILPLYYFSVLLFFIVIFPLETRLGWPAHHGIRDFVWYFFHLSNWWVGSGHMSASPISHFWSLAIEEQFYFVWPVVVSVLPTRSLTWCALGIAVLSCSLRITDAVMYPHQVGFEFYTPYRMDPIAIGSLAAIFAEDEQAWSKLASCRNYLFWGGFTLWMATLFIGDNRGITVFGISAIGAVALAMLIDAVNGRSAFNTPFFRHLGKYSYALYVIHYPILFLTSFAFRKFGRFGNFFLPIAVGIPLTYLLARASWILLEQPFLRLKSRFEYGSRRLEIRGGARASEVGRDAVGI